MNPTLAAFLAHNDTARRLNEEATARELHRLQQLGPDEYERQAREEDERQAHCHEEADRAA